MKPKSVVIKPIEHRTVETVCEGMHCQDCPTPIKILFPPADWTPSDNNVRHGHYHVWRGWCGACRITYWPADGKCLLAPDGRRDFDAEIALIQEQEPHVLQEP